MKLNHILEGIEVLSIVGNEDIEVLNVEYDSRKVEEGTLFICIKGFVSDGHKYIDSAYEKELEYF